MPLTNPQSAQSVQTQNLLTLNNSTGALTISGGNNITVGNNANTITISGPNTVAQSVQPGIQSIQASNTTYTTGNVIFSNANGLSFGSSAGGAITASYTVPNVPAQTNQTIGFFGLSNTTSSVSSGTLDARFLSFNAMGNVSVGYSNGSIVISGSAVAGGGITNINVSASNTSANLSNLAFSNSNGLAFGLSNSTITGSYTVPTITNSSWTVSDSATSATVGRLAFTNLNGVTMTLSTSNNGNHTLIGSVKTDYQSSGAYLTTAMQSASSSVFAKTGFSTASTAGSDIVGTHDTNGLSMGIPKYLTTAQAPGAYLTTAALSQNTSNYAGINGAITGGSMTVNTSGVSVNLPAYLTTAMASNASTQFVQANAGFNGTNASGTIASNSISVSVSAPPLIKNYTMPDMFDGSFVSSNGAVSYVPMSIGNNLSATRAMLLGNMSGASNSTGGFTWGIQVFTLNASTASEVSSASTAITWSSSSAINSTTQNQYGGQSGTRYRSMAIGTWNFTPGNYLIGQWIASTNAGTWTFWGSTGISMVTPVDVGESQNWQAGFSTSSIASWSARATSLNLTAANYVRSGSSAGRQPGYILLGTI